MREQQLGEVMVEIKDNLEEVAGLVVAAGGATALAPRRLGRMRLGLAVSERTKAKRGGVSEETAAITGAKPRRQAATADAAGGSRSSRRRQVHRQVKRERGTKTGKGPAAGERARGRGLPGPGGPQTAAADETGTIVFFLNIFFLCPGASLLAIEQSCSKTNPSIQNITII
jgi:hypothetical protein